MNIVCLLETRVKEHKMQTTVQNQFSGWNFIQNYAEAPNGRIWMLWNGDINVSILAVTDQCITCKV